MLFNYNTERKYGMSITLTDGTEVKGEYLDYRIDPNTIPEGKEWYQIRHDDEDWSEPVSIKRGGIMINFLGTFICDHIKGMEDGEEKDIYDYEYVQ